MLRLFSVLAALHLISDTVQAECYEAAAKRYAVSESLLRAIAKVESGNRDARTVENVNANGTKDIGRMQINTGWLPKLKEYGIGETELRDECTSIHVGAWILSQNIRSKGLTWDAVGAYNVGCKSLGKGECQARRGRYAQRVYRALKTNEQQEAATAASLAIAQPRKSTIGSVEFHVD